MTIDAAQWIRDALATTGKSQKGLAAALGITQPQVSRLVTGKRRLRAAEIPVLESYFGISYPQRTQSMPLVPVLSRPTSTRTIVVRFVICSCVWREKGSKIVDQTLVAASPDPRLENLEQYSCRIEGSNMRDLVGQYAVCVPYKDLRLSPVDGDIVHVVRFRDDLEEHTLRTVNIRSGAVYLVPYIADTADAEPLSEAEILGLVVAFQKPIRF